jgi:structural maintenance of chromosome 2
VESDLGKEKKSAEKLAAKCEASTKKVAVIQAQVDQLGFSEENYNALEQEKHQLESAVADLSERVDTLSAQLQGRLAFQYSDPVRGFDRSKVKGIVAKLIDVKDPHNSTALEVAAGGKLFQVVVDEAITGKALLDRGRLARRVTIIPLDKIKSRAVSHAAAQRADSIATSMNATAQPAIELVGFDEEIRSAVEYVFGATIVVDGMKAANQICDATKTRTVTLEGDVYDPSGTISGGSKNQLGTTLTNLSTLAESTRDLEEKRKQLQTISAALASQKAASAKYDKLHTQLELARAELDATKKHLSQTSFGVLVEKQDSMTAELQTAQEECVMMEKEHHDKWELYEQLKEREVELTQQREQRLADIEQSVKTAKVDAADKTRAAREVRLR